MPDFHAAARTMVEPEMVREAERETVEVTEVAGGEAREVVMAAGGEGAVGVAEVGGLAVVEEVEATGCSKINGSVQRICAKVEIMVAKRGCLNSNGIQDRDVGCKEWRCRRGKGVPMQTGQGTGRQTQRLFPIGA